jgi:DNA-directed RNA polymerase subunit H (RpoH/RPB5)
MNEHSNFEMTVIERQHSALATITNMLIARKWISDDFQTHYNTLTGNNQSEQIDVTTIVYNTTKVVIKFYDIKINSLKNDKEIDALFAKFTDYHKILVVTDFSSKIDKQVADTKNLEVFKEIDIIRDIAKHHLVPQHILLSKEEVKQFMEEYKLGKLDMGRIYIDDPMAKYLYAKKDDIIKIIRESIYTGYSVNYRLVVLSSINS